MNHKSQTRWACGTAPRIFLAFFGAVTLSLLGACASTQRQTSTDRPSGEVPPEHASGYRNVDLVRAKEYMVATAHPLATQAGLDILNRGGSALDAAIAIQAMLTLVEPQSSGIGGGAFMMYWDATARAMLAYDGRETAPARVDADWFVDSEGRPMEFFDAVVGGRSVGTPGVVRMLEMAHRKHGRLPWATLFDAAIKRAALGFELSPRLYRQLSLDTFLARQPAARAYFYQTDGSPKPIGTLLRNPKLAAVLRAIADTGADAFYTGDIALAMVEAVRTHSNPGALSLTDLADYKPKIRDPVCRSFRGYRICGMPPPTAGGLTTLQILGILEHLPIVDRGPTSVQTLHLLAEAERLAYADRDVYIGDPDFVSVPVDALLAPAYLKQRASLIHLDRSMGKAEAGLPLQLAERGTNNQTPATCLELPSTSHMVIFDGQGDVLSMTTSVENVFGSRLMVEGFLLNNQLTDFAFVPQTNGHTAANAVAPHKRPRSSMAPTIVIDGTTQRPVLALGSPGGSRIIGYVAQTLLHILGHGLDPQTAISLPHVVNRNGDTELEDHPRQQALVTGLTEALQSLGHRVKVGPQNSGLQAIMRRRDELLGAADPRREGVAAGK